MGWRCSAKTCGSRAMKCAAHRAEFPLRFSTRWITPRAIFAPWRAARNRKSGRCEVEPGVRASQRVRPIETVGCYLPGGRFSLVSTLLMTAIPAQEAGVRNIVIASPQPGDELLAAAQTLGLRQIARVGGAQAIAALAYGTQSIPRVDKIFGPGNRYVTAAKRLVSADCAIDLLAGPTEAVVFARGGNPVFIAADLLAQAEHDPDAVALFVTTSPRFWPPRRCRDRNDSSPSFQNRIPPGARSRKTARCSSRATLPAPCGSSIASRRSI